MICHPAITSLLYLFGDGHTQAGLELTPLCVSQPNMSSLLQRTGLKSNLNTNRVKKFSRELAAYRGDLRASPGRSVTPHSKAQTHPCSWCAVVMLGPCAQRLTGFPGTTVRLGCFSWSSSPGRCFCFHHRLPTPPGPS